MYKFDHGLWVVICEITVKLWYGLDWVLEPLDLGLVVLGLLFIIKLGDESFTPKD